ncbi:CRISPR-associated protein Cas5 [Geoglobus acetivorans]|uniref:CRISPR-associated protein Cas5 n=1 Tax=Geoglobus acetivorans TaxID=565033 RepID=A0ABZ3H6M3_GEOAI|nr:CRISPR-associated protein Cas5 [Geoglobus acetivorans]
MSEKTLYIEIFQPFAQYRNPFTFYYAQSYPLPPKSTLIGMLQNATNDFYGHKFGIENWWSLKTSIHGGFETVFWNYQQMIKGEIAIGDVGLINKHDRNPLGKTWHPLYHSAITAQRTPVYQQELFNGHIHVFLRGNKEILEKIESSLNVPNKVLYLGRSEDVVFVKKAEFVDGVENTAKKSLWLTYPTYIRKEIRHENGERKEFPMKNQKYPVYSIPVCVLFLNDGTPVKNKAEITKKTERKVSFDTVVYTGFDYVVKLSESITYEEFQINGKKFRIISEFGWL